MDFQLLARWAQKVPRWAWNSLGVVIYTVCALAGRDNLAAIFTNFLALMGYWVAVWIAITVEEHLLFRNGRVAGGIGKGWNWEDWNTRENLPLGLAALVAFLIGWVGSILCMAQVWYHGPIAVLVGDYGADVSSTLSYFLSMAVAFRGRDGGVQGGKWEAEEEGRGRTNAGRSWC